MALAAAGRSFCSSSTPRAAMTQTTRSKVSMSVTSMPGALKKSLSLGVRGLPVALTGSSAK